MLNRITAGLAALTSLVHIFIGGKDALAPMLESNLPLPSEGAMHACWHMVSCLLFWSIFVFWKGGNAAFHFGLIWLASAFVFLYVAITQSGFSGLILHPQWTILALTGALVLWNSRTKRTFDFHDD